MTHIFLAILFPKIKEFFLLMITVNIFWILYFQYIYSVELSILILAIDSDIYACYYIVTNVNRNT